MNTDPSSGAAQPVPPERDKLARMMCAAFQGIPVETLTDEEWPASDRNVKRWTAVADMMIANFPLLVSAARGDAASAKEIRPLLSNMTAVLRDDDGMRALAALVEDPDAEAPLASVCRHDTRA